MNNLMKKWMWIGFWAGLILTDVMCAIVCKNNPALLALDIVMIAFCGYWLVRAIGENDA